MDVDMDMDIDLSYEDPEIARLQAEAAVIEARAAESTEQMNGVEQAPEEGEVNMDDPAPTKVYLHGVDNLTTNDIKNYAAEHFSTDLFSNKVQWIDDSSANLIYETDAAGEEALMAFSAEEVMDLQQLRPAKRLSTHPDTELSVRQAKISDHKVAGAKDRSRFYLMNPEHDPDNRPRRRNDRNDRRGGGRRYQRAPEDRYSRRDSQDGEPFDVNLYDDAPEPAARDRRSSRSPRGDRRRRDGDLFEPRKDGRLRDRSASPTRDGDGRYGFDDDQPRRRTARHRSRSPPRRGSENREPRKELFPTKAKASNGAANGNDRAPSPMDTKELFPGKATPNHKRRGARDLSKEVMGRPVPERDLFSRVGDQGESSHGRLKGDDKFTFKGASNAPGFSILGASSQRVENPLVKELFPQKGPRNDSGGKDLFDGRIKGRANQRRRAEDLF